MYHLMLNIGKSLLSNCNFTAFYISNTLISIGLFYIWFLADYPLVRNVDICIHLGHSRWYSTRPMIRSTAVISITGAVPHDVCLFFISLQWCDNGHEGVSNHQAYHCLLNRLARRRSKKTSKLDITGLCAGNSPVTGEFTAQMASNAENVSLLMTSSCSMPSVRHVIYYGHNFWLAYLQMQPFVIHI